MEYLPVTVDKSHLITIGERLYSESIELIRELVNNAYDADATEVDIKITKELIEVSDNGTGMDREGLKQYFNIGSPEKIMKAKSPELIFDQNINPNPILDILKTFEQQPSASFALPLVSFFFF